jgi:hypothetical protein
LDILFSKTEVTICDGFALYILRKIPVDREEGIERDIGP